jgi:uncharacterized membrane protein
MIETYTRRKQFFYQWLRVALVGLIALRVSGLWLLEPTPPVSSAIGLTMMLVLFLWPVLRQDIKGCLWLSFASCLFFTTAVLNAMTEGREVYGIVESVLAASVFIAAMLFARNAYRELAATEEASTQSSTSTLQ